MEPGEDDDVGVGELSIVFEQEDSCSDVRISVAVSVPTASIFDKYAGDDEKFETWGIAWSMAARTAGGQSSDWVTKDHFSMLPNGWIPHDSLDFFQQFVTHLTKEWSDMAEEAKGHLRIQAS